MSRFCPKCNCEAEGSFSFCPKCGTKLPEDTNVVVNIGDANAISGGVHINNSQTVNKNDIHYHTVHERSKTRQEIFNEAKTEYRKAVLDLSQNGIINGSVRAKLDSLRTCLGLDLNTTQTIETSIKNEIKNSSTENEELPDFIKRVLKSIEKCIGDNPDIENPDFTLFRDMQRLAPVVETSSNEQVHFYHFMLKAMCSPEECISYYESGTIDSYWLTYWSAHAYIKSGKYEKADEALYKCSAFWREYPDANIDIMEIIAKLHHSRLEICNSIEDTKQIARKALKGINNPSNELKDLLYALQKECGLDGWQQSKYLDFYLDNFVKIRVNVIGLELMRNTGSYGIGPFDTDEMEFGNNTMANITYDPIQSCFLFEEAENYEFGYNVSADIDKAFKLYYDAAKAGNPDAMCHIGYLMMFGYGTMRHTSNAHEWLDAGIAASTDTNSEYYKVAADLKFKLSTAPCSPVYRREKLSIFLNKLDEYNKFAKKGAFQTLEFEDGKLYGTIFDHISLYNKDSKKENHYRSYCKTTNTHKKGVFSTFKEDFFTGCAEVIAKEIIILMHELEID